MYHSGNQLIDPYILFQKVQLQPNMHVADFGCGRTGHIVFPAATIVGEMGIVYAVDILKDALAEVGKRAALDKLHNIHAVWSNVEQVGGTAIPPCSLDVIFLVHTLIHSDKREKVLSEAERLLKDKGRLVVVDWTTAASTFNIDSKKLIDFSQVLGWAQSNNFVVQEAFELGKYHHGVVLYRHE